MEGGLKSMCFFGLKSSVPRFLAGVLLITGFTPGMYSCVRGIAFATAMTLQGKPCKKKRDDLRKGA